MKVNFKIVYQRQKGIVHLFPHGQLDGSSAFELNDVIRRGIQRTKRIIVHTGELRTIHPFGVEIFQRSLPIPVLRRLSVEFSGKNAHRIIHAEQEDDSFEASPMIRNRTP